MDTLKRFSGASLVFAATLISGCSDRHPSAVGSPESRIGGEVIGLRDTVRGFLSTCLKKKDTERAIEFFSAQAFQNQYLLSASCLGYSDPDPVDPQGGLRERVRTLLREALEAPGLWKPRFDDQTLGEIRGQAGKHLVNDPGLDGFALLRIPVTGLVEETDEEPGSPFLAAEDAESQYLSRMLPKEAVLCFVPFGDGIVYFIWIRDQEQWRIYHANVYCM